MNRNQIEHQGVVERIMAQHLSVVIVQETACGSCAVAGLCHSAEKNQKKIDIPCLNPNQYKIGQNVTIIGEVSLGLRATLWAYVVPLMLLISVLLFVTHFTHSEGFGACTALLSLIPYYILLYVLREHLQRKFSFRIKEENPT